MLLLDSMDAPGSNENLRSPESLVHRLVRRGGERFRRILGKEERIQLPRDKQELDRYGSEQQYRVLAAMNDRLTSIITGPIGFRELRQSGVRTRTTEIEDLDRLLRDLAEFKQQIVAAETFLGKHKKPLPEIHEDPVMSDFKYTDYNKIVAQGSQEKP